MCNGPIWPGLSTDHRLSYSHLPFRSPPIVQHSTSANWKNGAAEIIRQVVPQPRASDIKWSFIKRAFSNSSQVICVTGTYRGNVLHSRKCTNLWLRRRILIKVHFAKVISAGKKLLMMRTTTSVNIGAVRTFLPHTYTQTDRQIDRQTHRQRQTYRQTQALISVPSEPSCHIPTHRQTDR